MQGLHLTADLYQCRCEHHWLTHAKRLDAWLCTATRDAGLQVVNKVFHTFPSTAKSPGGITCTLLLAESHLCVHTWPEQGNVTLDLYVCNFSTDHSDKAELLMSAMVQLFAPQHVQQHALVRGSPLTTSGTIRAPQTLGCV